MHLTSRLSHSLRQPATASALLGPEHPFACVLDRLVVVLKQSLVAAALLSASVSAVIVGASGALACAVAAAVVQAWLACRAALLAQTMRWLVLDLIIEGRGNLPL